MAKPFIIPHQVFFLLVTGNLKNWKLLTGNWKLEKDERPFLPTREKK